MAAFRCLAAALLLLVALPPALCLPHDSDAKIVSRPKRSALPNQWWHHPDHPASALFKRQANETGAAVGSPEWAALFPTGPPENNLPELWRQTLAAAVADGRIPNIPVPANTGGGPVYPPGSNPSGDEICSTTFRCREPGVIWDAPDGMIGLSFDDGPLAPSARLYDFLEANNQKATHFMIGQNILFNPQLFLQAFDDLKSDMSCHTWSHRHTATLTNDQVLAELGWCLQIIHDSTGGRIPRFWRPPYGEADRRVTAIAREVFGLTTVIWNYDTADWQLGQSPEVTLPGIHQQFLQWTSGPKSPGLMILEHELSEGAVDAFIDAYPLFAANGWETVPISELYDLGWYQNADDSTSPVVAANVGAGSISAPPPTSSSAPPPPATTAAATSTPPAGGAASVGNNNDAVAFSPSSRWSASVALGSLVLGLFI